MLIDIRQPVWPGLCVGIFSSLQGWLCVRACVPCNVLKIALGSVGKVLGCVQLLRCVQIGWRTTWKHLRRHGIRIPSARPML